MARKQLRKLGFRVSLGEMRTVYFDYNATTPLDAGVKGAMLPFLDEIYGNPSSLHHVGQKARVILDEARERVADVLGAKPSEVVFTSGGTESNNMAILGAARLLRVRGRHLITTGIEHHAVLNCFEFLARHEGFELTVLLPDSEGRIDPDQVKKALRPDTILVSVMAANNETGALQPAAEIGALCRERGVVFHTDAVQWFGKEPLDHIAQFNADMVSICSHKFHGPKGCGALYIRSPLQPVPLLLGGSHENERRAGTENLAAIAGFAFAMERFMRPPVFPQEPLRQWTQHLIDRLSGMEGVRFRGCAEHRLPNTAAFTVQGVDSVTLLAALDLGGVCASSGSACSSGALEPSHVMMAMGLSREEAHSLVRFSLGRETTWEEVLYVESLLPEILRQARSVAATTSPARRP